MGATISYGPRRDPRVSDISDAGGDYMQPEPGTDSPSSWNHEAMHLDAVGARDDGRELRRRGVHASELILADDEQVVRTTGLGS
jgi:hypothetical protein